VKAFASKRRLSAIVFVILLILFLVRPGASRLKIRIANSLSRALDRPVEIGAVHLRFLPRPGFDLENLVIDEDPAFGAEPMLRAPEVTTVVRLTSLLRGRLDVSKLELTEPSLNLVRRKEDGRWNWESLLERTVRTTLAPTTKSKSELRVGFPYIEASSGRINFKLGTEKKPYALLNADFALWQESENGWGVRLKAEPTRTDMNLSDAGVLEMNGSWQRAESLRETPLQFALEWNRAQLGQLTKLVSGIDKGWRGDVRLEVTLHGTPGGLQVGTDAAVQNFHHYDIAAGDGLGVTAHCDGKYNSAEGVMREIFCSAPVGNGLITLHGDAGRPGAQMLDLAINAENIPANSVAQLARRVKKDLPSDLVATGMMRGNVTVKRDGEPQPQIEGRVEITNLRAESASENVGLAPGNVPFTISSQEASEVVLGKNANRQLHAGVPPPANELRIEYGPFGVGLGRAAVAQVRGWFARSGYCVSVRGDGEISHILKVADALGLPAIKANAQGDARMDLEIAGSWAGTQGMAASNFSPPQITGTTELHNVRATIRGVNEPVEISSAELRLLPEEARLDKLNAHAADSHWIGSVVLPRGCGTPGACVVRFKLNADAIAMGGLYSWLSPSPNEHRWYEALTSRATGAPTFVERLRASGSISAARLLVHNFTMNQVSADLDIDSGKLKISDLRFDALDGKHDGEWIADFTGPAPVYTGSGTLTNVSLSQIADVMHDQWISGTATGTYQFKTTGRNSPEFWGSAQGGFRFDVHDGALSHISLENTDDPLTISRWRGTGQLRKGRIEIEKSEISSSTGTYGMSGTVTLGQALDLKLTGSSPEKSVPGALVYSITGTLARPEVSVSPPETQARLKP
jgi:hypothetical protein